jgi:uncharacterized protein YndB with AHSA1/START domain
MALEQIERETTIDAPVERVWSVLTEPEHVIGWFTKEAAEIDLRPGGAMTLTFAQHGRVRARVEAVEPPRRFAYRWTAHFAGDAEPADGNSTLVEFILTPDGDGTRLRVVESGFDALATTAENAARNHELNTGGWTEMVERVAQYAQRVAA